MSSIFTEVLSDGLAAVRRLHCWLRQAQQGLERGFCPQRFDDGPGIPAVQFRSDTGQRAPLAAQNHFVASKRDCAARGERSGGARRQQCSSG